MKASADSMLYQHVSAKVKVGDIYTEGQPLNKMPPHYHSIQRHENISLQIPSWQQAFKIVSK